MENSGLLNLKEVAKYFMDFLETDFHKRKNPRRTIKLRSEDNLPVGTRFLEAYGKAEGYALLPAIWKGTGEPQLLLDLAILKRKLSVKEASEIAHNNIEAMAAGLRD